MSDYRSIRQYDHALMIGEIVSSDFDVWISGEDSYATPAPVYETVTVPGRPGALLIDEDNPGRFQNRDFSFPCFISRRFPERFAAFRQALLALRGYQKIRTTYHMGEYRLGYLSADIEPDTGPYNDSGRFVLTFSCQPQRWLDSGSVPQQIQNGAALANPTGHTALPLIQVQGSGSGALTIAGATLTLNDCDGVMLDCQQEDAYRGTENLNLTVSGDYPVLGPGLSPVSWSGGINGVNITARWWRP